VAAKLHDFFDKVSWVQENPFSHLKVTRSNPMFAPDVYNLLKGTSDAAFVVTLDGEICFWNRAAEQLFGYTAADVHNRTCDDVLKGAGALGTPLCAKKCSVQSCAAHMDSIPAFDLEVTTRDGERRWVSITTIVFEDSRQHRRLVAHLSHDISKRKEAEECFMKMLEVSREIVSIGSYPSRPAPVESLSEQQRRILMLFSQAKNSGQVANELRITLPTLRNHLHTINQKLRTHNRLEAVLQAMRRGLI
jgi:PAS domain S-box-containing protein